MDVAVALAVGATICVGLVGTVVPVLPGLLLVWAGVLVWALWERTGPAWVLLVVASGLVVLAQVVKYVLPGRRLRQAGVPARSIAAGGIVGLVGFVVLPVVGLPLGFVAGVYAAEWGRQRDRRAAWGSSVDAVQAVGLSVLVEMLTGLLLAAGWLGVVLLG